ncbi:MULTISPECIES: aspartate kinase [unclassified Apibacter]|uniref:aspartate kinase n=1 Tax=unclassified Apibacter TaxID=2630820 RepID=UPI00132AC3B9|nr:MULTISPECIES: aspartate kinase [unclassified Apibacter]MCX8677122.1 aspartate kinase [Apibacter sp. B3919]MXO24498.1 aspartate kinase [Apibacter sp. B3924]MXO25742.1 aspartate kinase [Apibacter sp. B3813]MXO27693.1 aspartate kinase [Apibacter sp. B3913]MXO29947.1 aspartate kinase [Apibacter sp. B3912]
MLVLKFGGTSVGSAERIKNLAELTKGKKPKIVVLSAMSGTTNALVEISQALYEKNTSKAKELIQSLEDKYRKEIKDLYKNETIAKKGNELLDDYFNYIASFLDLPIFTSKEEKIILAQGELLSTHMFHFYMSEIGEKTILLPALEFMRINKDGEPDFPYIEERIKEEIKKYPDIDFFITQGYICKNAQGDIDNLQRGGSDYTACIIGAVIDAEEIQIWTDIDGMHNNDPRFVNKTHPINELSFDEAAELAYFGAKILHPTCILPAQKRGIPVALKNTMQPEAKGTLIGNINTPEGIRAVAAKDGIYAITIKSGRMLLAYGFLKTIFEIFDKYKTSIDMITTSEVAVSLTIDNPSNLEYILKELREIANVEYEKDQTIIAIVGNIAKNESGYAVKILEALKNIPLHMISYGGSEHNISVVIDSKSKKEALQALNTTLFGY